MPGMVVHTFWGLYRYVHVFQASKRFVVGNIWPGQDAGHLFRFDPDARDLFRFDQDARDLFRFDRDGYDLFRAERVCTSFTASYRDANSDKVSMSRKGLRLFVDAVTHGDAGVEP